MVNWAFLVVRRRLSRISIGHSPMESFVTHERRVFALGSPCHSINQGTSTAKRAEHEASAGATVQEGEVKVRVTWESESA